MNYKILLLVIGITLIQTLIFAGIFWDISSDCGIKEVKCYDMQNNEIIGQTCMQNNGNCSDETTLFLITILVSLFLLGINIILYLES